MSVASSFYTDVFGHIALVFVNDGGVDEVFERPFWTNIYTALWVRSPAVVSLIPMIVRVSIGCVLDTVVAFSVEPVSSLCVGGANTSSLLLPPSVHKRI